MQREGFVHMKLFKDNQPFYRANLHAHTTRSDGRLSPEECLRLYRGLGYDIVALTDHKKVTVPEDVPEGMLHLPGVELDYNLPTQVVHLVGVGVSEDLVYPPCPTGNPQEAVDALRKYGARVILAHPAWSLNQPEYMGSLQGIAASEVWNSVSTVPYNAKRADSSSLLDVCAANGTLFPMVASDDTHFYDKEIAGGWTMIQADELTVPSVLEAIDRGRFYATQGPAFHQAEIENGELRITCSPVDTIVFYSNNAWVTGRTRVGEGMTESVYKIMPTDTFVRCEIIDAAGKSAWLSPIKIK